MQIDFKKLNGLVPAIAQDYKTDEVLMLAFMNKDALDKTIKTKKAWYYSRSRNMLWMKGEQSKNIQEVKEILVDCDNDTILLKIKQVGDAACHTGYKTCFYRNITGKIKSKKIFNPEEVYKK